MRRLARNSSKRVGTLFFNPGGPGAIASNELIGSGTGLMPFSDDLRDHFDIVAMDPRGVGISQQVRCDASLYNTAIRMNPYPGDQVAFDQIYDAWQAFGRSCADMTGELLANVDSVTTARDFDFVRAALGEEDFNFLGLSYGVVLGAAYAELFPERVRTLALDGAVDRTLSQPYLVLQDSQSNEATLEKFFQWCDRNTDCAVRNTSFPTSSLYRDLASRASHHPLTALSCQSPSSNCFRTVSASDIYLRTQVLLNVAERPRNYNLTPSSWFALGKALHAAYYNNDASAFSSDHVRFDNQTGALGSIAIWCLDVDRTITTFEQLTNLQHLLNSTSPYTSGQTEAYTYVLQCMAWPHPVVYPDNRFHFDAQKLPPALIVNALYDPEASYAWAVGVANAMPHSRLLTRDGAGHTSYLLGGEARDLTDRYLITKVLPPPGTVVHS
jgi:pimeloyl-ACP methyl ester carboxylesterase